MRVSADFSLSSFNLERLSDATVEDPVQKKEPFDYADDG